MLAMDWRRVRETLRDLRIESKMDVPELAEEAGVNKTTVYRLEELDEEPDRVIALATIEGLVRAMGLTLATFFARVEGTDLSRHSTDQESELQGGSDVPASAERDRLSRLESELSTLKAQFGVLQNATGRIIDRAFPPAKSRAAASGKAGGRRVPRNTS